MTSIKTATERDPKGHRATSPAEMPRSAWKDILARTYTRTWDDNVGIVAAGVAFYGFFALLSLLALLVLSYGLFADPEKVIVHVRTMASVLPSGVALLIGDQLMNAVRTSQEGKGLGILLAFLGALYGGTNGAAALLTALNIAYEEKEKRSLGRFYLIALGMTFTALGLALVALGSTATVALARSVVPFDSPAITLGGKLVGYVALTFVATGIAATLYRFGPSREQAQWRWITPGSLFAAVTWVLLTIGFGFYASRLTNYDAVYGSLGAVVALLTWLYISAYAFCFGAELNSEIEHQTAHDSTTGAPEPIGKRGAWAADNVASGKEVQNRPEQVRQGERLTQAAPELEEKS